MEGFEDVKKGAKYAAALLIAGAGVALVFLPVNGWVLILVEWIRGAGAIGVLAYGLVYVLATLFLLPGSILTAAAGFAYGPVWGTLLVSPVSVLAATLAFLLGRTLAKDWVSRRIGEHPRFAAINHAIGESGFKIVLLLRLSPILPFNLLNYALGLMRVRLRDYVLASFVGMLPGTFLYVYLGSLVANASELLSGRHLAGGVWGQVFYWGGMAATALVTVLITRIAHRALNRALQDKAEAGLRKPSEAQL